MATTVKKHFDILITNANKSYQKIYELDKTVKIIKGILLSSNKDDLAYFRGYQRVEINKEEIFDDGYESKLIMSSVSIPPNQRYYEIEPINAGNGIVKVDYQDLDDGRTTFSPYRVTIYLDCITN